MNLLILLLVFIATTLAYLSISHVLMRRWTLQSRLQQVLDDMAADSIGEVGARAHDAAQSSLAMRIFWEAFQRPGALMLPRDQWDQSPLKRQLVMAGWRQDRTLAIYMGVRIVLAVVLPVSYFISQLIVGIDPLRVMAISLVLAAGGFYLPVHYMRHRISQRQKQIGKALPNALDMLVVCVEAGLGLDGAVKRVGEEIKTAAPALGEELQLMSLELRAGKSRTEAFKNIGTRTGVDEVRGWAALMIQTDRFGTSVANALRVHADGMRVKRRQKLEEQAAKTTVKLIFPLVFFIFPAIMVVMVGPALIQIIRVLLPAMGGK